VEALPTLLGKVKGSKAHERVMKWVETELAKLPSVPSQPQSVEAEKPQKPTPPRKQDTRPDSFIAGQPDRTGDKLTLEYTRPDGPPVKLEYHFSTGLRVSHWNNNYDQSKRSSRTSRK
jgi:hypothetical protein